MALDRILVVDDTPIIRKSLEERLRGKRLSVSTAGSIAEAEKRLAANSFDLIFLDMELPDGDGRVAQHLAAGADHFVVQVGKLGNRRTGHLWFSSP